MTYDFKNITSVDFIESPAADATVLGINEGQIVQMPAGNVGGSGSGANSSYRLVITESEISYRTSNGDNIGYVLNLNDENELITAIESGTPIQLYFPDLNYGLNVLAIQPQSNILYAIDPAGAIEESGQIIRYYY